MCIVKFAGGLAAALLAIGAPASLGAEGADKELARKTIIICGETLELMTPGEVKALGFPWTDVPDGENAATYYIKGANALHELARDQEAERQCDHALEHGWDGGMKELAAHLDKAKPALDDYRKGALMKLCQLPYDRADMVAGMLLPSLRKTRDACRLLVIEARRFEAQGKFKEAVDNYITIIRIGNHYGAGRVVMIEHLVGIACIGIGTRSAFDGVYGNNYPANELKRFLKELDGVRANLPNFVHAMKCEKAFGLVTVDDVMRLGPQSWMQMGMPMRGWKLSPLQLRVSRIVFPDRTIKKDMAAYYDRLIAAAGRPYHLPEARLDDEKLLAQTKPWNFFAHMLLPALSRARAEAEECGASVEMLRIAVAIKMFQQDVGEYPESLRLLTANKFLKELPVDPFSGEPFVYKVKGGEFVLYSIGANFKDDGGKFGRENDFLDWGISSKLKVPKPFKRD
ncbi:MAG: type II secretion system protein GspG [Planctomycetota bacterium]